MLVPILEFQFNPGSGGGGGVTSTGQTFAFYSIAKQVQPFLIGLLTLGVWYLGF